MDTMSTAATLWRLPQVRNEIGLGKTAIYQMVRTGQFPRPRRLGARSVAWRRKDVEGWIASRPTTEPTTNGEAAR